jgi:hypothetical protein
MIVAAGVSAIIAAGPAGAAAPLTGEPLIPNGDFETCTDGSGVPDGWPPPEDGLSYEKEGNNRFLRLRSSSPGKTVLAYRLVALPSEVKALELSYRVRYVDIRVGKEPWFDGRIMMNFKSADNQTVDPSPEAPFFRETCKEWKTYRQQFPVPKGSTSLELMPTLFQAEGGTIDFDDVKLKSIDLSQIPPPPPPPPPVKLIPSTTVTPADLKALPPLLHVEGNQVKTATGKVVWLQGLSVDSMQWTALGERIQESIPVAIEKWKANVIRLPVLQTFWFGRGEGQADGGVAYRKLADAAVAAAATRGAYLVLDLHCFQAPLPEHVEFWKDAATRYANHPAVLFELFNEPHDISWEVWRNGGSFAAEDKEKATGNVSTGLQALVQAVRATGAKNLVLAAGLDWAYDLSGVVSGYALEDRRGNGVMYVTHIYPWKDDWQRNVIAAAARVPIIVTEVGCQTKPMPWQETTEDPATWAPDVIGLIQKYKLNWTAFSFHPGCSPMVISDWEYTPTKEWGGYVKEALAGKPYELKKLR